jgi:hypothetical protein
MGVLPGEVMVGLLAEGVDTADLPGAVTGVLLGEGTEEGAGEAMGVLREGGAMADRLEWESMSEWLRGSFSLECCHSGCLGGLYFCLDSLMIGGVGCLKRGGLLYRYLRSAG